MEEQDSNLKQFRIFKIADGFEVWVGKNSTANDLLSMQYTLQNDLWFHVHGYSGSHTVLKSQEEVDSIPKYIIKIAASIAAYYSKAKNAGSVLVSYTKAKNVQKYRGAKSGSVTIKNEKNIKVKPGIPEDMG